MKRHRFDPIEVLTSHLAALDERLQAAVEPRQKDLLEKRRRNLEGVIQFLRTTSDSGAAAQALHPLSTADGVARTGNSPEWRSPMAPHCGNV